MTLKRVSDLLIGELCAGTARNEDGVVYIALGELGDEFDTLSIDEVEARALHEWLGKVLGEPDESSIAIRGDGFD